jgi:quercetin dioxygenase-like cupin family protein
MVLSSMAPHEQPVTVAQEATPGAQASEAGVTFEALAFAGQIDVTSPLDFAVARITLDPGATLPIDARDPTVGILLAQSGTFTVQVQGPITVNRGAGLVAAMATAEATGDMSGMTGAVAPGEAVTLETGDAAFIPGNVSGEIRNDGTKPAVGLGFLAHPSEGSIGEATPAP